MSGTRKLQLRDPPRLGILCTFMHFHGCWPLFHSSEPLLNIWYSVATPTHMVPHLRGEPTPLKTASSTAGADFSRLAKGNSAAERALLTGLSGAFDEALERIAGLRTPRRYAEPKPEQEGHWSRWSAGSRQVHELDRDELRDLSTRQPSGAWDEAFRAFKRRENLYRHP